MYCVFKGNKLVQAFETHREAVRFVQRHHGCRVVYRD